LYISQVVHLGWTTKGTTWEIYNYQTHNASLLNGPGPVARFAGRGTTTEMLVRKFPAVTSPTSLTLTFDAGWGWGAANQSSDDFNIMLLDDDGNGYVFNVHRAKEKWAAQWGAVKAYVMPDTLNWSPTEIDATQASVIDGGNLQTFTITRDANGAWQFSGAKWTGGTPFAFTEPAITTTTFSQVVLLGKPNVDDLVFNKIKLEATK